MMGHITLPGSKRTLLPGSRPAGPADPSEIADLTVRVRSSGDLKALAKWTSAEAVKPLSEREYLTHEDFVTQYGASKQDLDKVEGLANEHDLAVVHRSAAERSVVLRGQLGDLLAAFPADVALYHHAAGTYRGRKGEIAIPQEFDGIITGVFGFDTRPKRRAPYRQKRFSQAGPGAENGVAATEFAARYNFPSAEAGAELDGSGQTIAIIELGGGFRRSDLRRFFQEIGETTPSVTAVSVDHAGDHPTTAESADGEVMLDIEVAGAVVPKA